MGTGANPTMVIRVAANLAELRANLAEGKSQIETTTAAMQKLATSFSGDKLIQSANNTVAAIAEIGGIAKLTGAEQDRVNSILDRALEKYRALGREAPPGMQALADATRKVKDDTNGWSETLGQANHVLGLLGLGLSAAGVISFGREVLAAGDHIQKMADQTSLSTSEVQRLMYIAGQSGTSVEGLVGAVQNLQQRLGSGDAGAVGAIKRLNINLDDFAKLGSYEQMTTLSDAILHLHSPTEQATVAAELFGKSWKEILPALKAGMREVGEQAPIMADDTVKALDRIGDAMTRAKGQSVVWGAGLIQSIEGAGFAVGNFLGLFDPEHFGQTHTQFLKLQQRLTDPDGLIVAMSKAELGAANLMPKMAAIVPPGLPKDLKDIEIALTDDAKALIELDKTLQEMDKATFQLAMDHQRQWREEVEKTKNARNKIVTEGLTQLQRAEADYNDFIARESLDSLTYQTQKIWQRVAEEEAAFKGSEEQRASYNASVEALAWEEEQALRAAADAAAVATEASAARSNAANMSVVQSWGEIVDAAARAAGVTVVGHRAGEPGSEINGGGRGQPITGPGGTLSLGGGGATDPRVLAIMGMGFTLNEAIAMLNGSAGHIAPAARASGGPVTSGTPYLVGERGPELFVPNASGSIVPNGAAAGATTIHIHVTQPLGTPQAIADAVDRALMSKLRGGGLRVPSGA